MRTSIRKIITEYLFPRQGAIVLDDDMDLRSDLGLSSLDMMTIIYLIEDETKTKVSFEKLSGVQTLGQLYNVFSKYE